MAKARFLARRASIAAAIAASCAYAAPVVRPDHLRDRGAILAHPIVPAQFRGHWSVDRAACDADAVDESQAWITDRAVNFFETNGHVVRVALADARHAVVTLRSEGEGTVFMARKGLALSPDGGVLTMRNEDDTGATRFRRCPHHPMHAH